MAIFPKIRNALVLRSTALFSRTLRQCNSEPPQRVLSPPALEIFTESCGNFANGRNKTAFSGKEDQYAASTIKANSTALPKLDESPLGFNPYVDGKRLIAPIPLLTKEHDQVLRKSHTSGCNYFKTRSGTTLIGIMLPNGIVIGSDGRGTIEDIDGRDLIGGDNYDKVIDLGKNVFCAVSGEVNQITRLIHHIRANTVFNPREHRVESLAREAFSYLLQCGSYRVSVLIAGVDSVRPCLWCVSSVKSHNGQYRITHKDVKVWKAIGSGSGAAGDFLELVVKDNVSFAKAFTACKIGLLVGALFDPCSGGVLLVQHLRLDGIHLLLKTNALDLLREFNRFIDLQEKSLLLVYKIESVSAQAIRNWAEGMGNGTSNPLEELGHPLVKLMGGFYTQKVTFKSKWAALSAFKRAQRVTVCPIFARKIKGIRSFILNGALIHVCLARNVDLENLVIEMPPTKPLL